MKITANPVGNYGPGYTPSVKPQSKPAESFSLPGVNTGKVEKGSLTSEEKDFFVNMYPQNKNEIIDYHFYQKSGKMSGVSVGSLFDRRG